MRGYGVAQDPSDAPVIPDLVQAELAHFTKDGRRLDVDTDELARRGVLPRFLCEQVDLTMSTDPLGQRRVAELLAHHLSNFVSSARQWVIGHRGDRGYKEACKVAAAGELVGLTDEKQFEQILVQLKGRRVDFEAQYATAKRRHGKKDERQVRATVWLDGLDDNNKFSPNYAYDRQEDLIATFCLRLADHIQRNKEALVAELMKTGATAVPEPEALSSPDESEHKPLHPTYIQRRELEIQFKAYVAEVSQFDMGVKVIILVGLAGMGKTWLAEELTRDPETGKPAEFKDVDKYRRLSHYLPEVFSTSAPQLPTSEDISVEIATLARSEDAPRFIVLDNLESADELKDLLPRHTRSIIVATCRRKGESPATYRYVDVDRMERDESVEMISRELPRLSDKDKKDLAEAFSDYPLVISRACALFPNQAAPMVRFCDQLKADARKLASQVKTEDGAILLVILRRLVTLVKRRDRSGMAYELLVVAAFIAPRLPYPILSGYLKTFPGDGRRGDVRLPYAIDILRSLSLIQVDPIEKMTIIHPFIAVVLMGEFEQHLEEVFVRFVLLARLSARLKPLPEDIYDGYVVYGTPVMLRWIERLQPQDFSSWPAEKKVQAINDLVERYVKASNGTA